MLTNLARPLVQALRKRVNSARGPHRKIMHDEIDQGVTPSDDAKELMLLAKSVLAKYWIIVCCAAFLLVALQSEVSLYQIFYMVIFLMGFVVYQVKELLCDLFRCPKFFVTLFSPNRYIAVYMVPKMLQKSIFYVLYSSYMKFYFCYIFHVYVICFIMCLLYIYMYIIFFQLCDIFLFSYYLILNLYDNVFIFICTKLL